jgi:hypothetical protein
MMEIRFPPPNLNMGNLSVRILRFTDPHQPGFVECELIDADGYRHSFEDKVPVFTAERLDAASEYPRPGSIRCEIMERWTSADGRDLVRVSTARPDSVDSQDGLSEFVVLPKQLEPAP